MQLPLRFFIEVILALLGGFILWLALVSHKFPDRHAPSWLMLSIALMIWGAITFFRARGSRIYWVDRIGGVTLLLVGGLMLMIIRVPFDYVLPLFAATGGLLVLRGIAGGALVSRGMFREK
ncbi:MAG: hypothetical protein JSS69_15225 [Acidobacteria bacterium]|nr:hypothetical protein [Acidobacteriota bacterium]MBS1867264.1 hypothetical protein [Acidobacteriota bacterium]